MVNDTVYDKWRSFKFSRSIDGNCGQFSLPITNTYPRELPIQGNDEVKIYLGDKIVFTGWVNTLSDSGSLDGSVIDIGGNDKTIDLVDSSVPDKAKNTKGQLTLKQMCEQVIKSIGLDVKVIDATSEKLGDKKVTAQKTADSGEKCLSFLVKMATKFQVWLVTDEESNLVIMKAGEVNSNHELYYLQNGKNKNNILDACFDIDLRQLFNQIKVRGQKSLGFNADSKNAADFADVNSHYFDLDARESRYLEVKAKENMSKAEMQQRAKDEVNFRKAKAYKYKCTLNSFLTKDGNLLRLGELIKVEDEKRGISGLFIIKSFDVSFDLDKGTTVDLELAPKEAYQTVDLDANYEKLNSKGKKVRKAKKKNVS